MNGLYSLSLIKYFLAGIVFIYLGQKLGLRIADYLKPKTFRLIVYVVVLISGIMTVCKY